MKTHLFSLILAATLTAAAAAAAAAAASRSAESEHPLLVIRKQDNPIAPQRFSELGILDGEVRAVISVDSTGHLSEWLIVGYSHPALADAVVAAIKRWEFDPPKMNGNAVSVQRELQFRFESRGTVVSIDSASYIESYLAQRFPGRDAFWPCSLKELDRIPTPTNTPAPIPTKKPTAHTENHVTVEFFIDTTGVARMPSVIAAEDPDLAAACVQAVRDWRFEPPTRQGKPALVRVQQTFRFQP